MGATGITTSSAAPPRSTMVKRLRALVDAKTTEMADTVLRVPLAFYRDPALLARERDLIMSTPLALVPTARLPRPNDYIVRDVLGTSVLVARAADGTARAFLNYCRHRGARVVAAGSCGSARRFTCPYHAWSYDDAGELVGMPGQEGFCDIERADYGLVELPSEERHGFVWVVPTAGAELDLDAHLGALGAELGAFGFAECEFFTEREFDARVSWKAALEAFAETYHFPYVHGGSIVGMNTVANTSAYDRFGRHHRLGFANPWIEGAPDLDEHPNPLEYIVFIYWIYPNLVVAVSPVGVELIDILPGDEPVACTVRHGWMALIPAGDAETRQGYTELFEQTHAAVRGEDFAVLPTCGDGIAHGQHDHMLIGRNEIGVQHVVRTLAGALDFHLPAG
jgi:nitrite reductase/ring-hydroxylating ferredoxin subunit